MGGTIWLDFDGTLVHRPAMWAQACLEALDGLAEGHRVDHSDLDQALAAGMPWHDPTTPHFHLNDPDLWWAAVHSRTHQVCTDLGVDVPFEQLSERLWTSITDARKYKLFEDTIEGLEMIRACGWRAAVVSNHIPELEALCEGLGIRYVEWVLTSAALGYEKPHDAVFETALNRTTSHPVWMIGDSVEADCSPALRHGLNAVLVRPTGPTVRFDPSQDTLLAAVQMICQ